MTTTFENLGDVHSQIGTQHNHGAAYNGPTYYITNNVSHDKNIINRGIEDAETSLSDNEILRCLAFPEMLSRRSNVDKAHPHTCEWVLQHNAYQVWDNQTSGLLWIKGKPGAGKSTIMAFLYNHLRSQRVKTDVQEVCLDFFFSARGTELQKRPVGMFRSLLNQVFYQASHVRPLIRGCFQERYAAFGHQGKLAQQLILSEAELKVLLIDAINEAVKSVRVHVFVDALDEAGENDAREIADFFHTLNGDISASTTSSIKICMSCRHYPIVATIPGSEIHVDMHNHQDIITYVNDKLLYKSTGAVGTKTKPDLELLRETLLQTSAGSFQWIHLMVPLVNGYLLDGEAPALILSRLQKLPQELNSLYEYILQDVIKPAYYTRSFYLFQWVCLAAEPLSLAKLRYAIAAKDVTKTRGCHETGDFVQSDTQMKHCVTAWSGGLLEVSQGLETVGASVQVIHQSVREYLLSGGLHEMTMWSTMSVTTGELVPRKLHPGSQDILSQCHQNLYKCCLNMFEWVSPDLQPLVPDEGDISNTEGYSWVEYATWYLFYHAGQAVDWKQSAIEQQMIRLTAVFGLWEKLYEELYEFYRYGFRPDHGGKAPNKTRRFTTLLHQVCEVKWMAALRCMDKSDVNTCDAFGNTPLHIAARKDGVEIAKILVEAGADVLRTNYLFDTPLMVAVSRGNITMASWLISRNGNSIRSKDNVQNALASAAHAGEFRLIRLLLAHGADIDAVSRNGMRPLEIAAFHNVFESVRELIEAGADIHATGGKYGTPLQAALYRQFPVTDSPKAPLGFDLDTIQLFMEAGADLDHHGTTVDTALCVAVWEQRTATAQLLLYLGADPSIPDARGFAPLHYAALHGLSNLVGQLISMGCEVNAQDLFGRSALHFTTFQANIQSSQMLLDAGADLLTPDGYGQSPLDLILEDERHCGTLWRHEPDDAGEREAEKIPVRTTPLSVRVATLQKSIFELATAVLKVNDVLLRPGLEEITGCLEYLEALRGLKEHGGVEYGLKIRSFIQENLEHGKDPDVITCCSCGEQCGTLFSVCKTCTQGVICYYCERGSNSSRGVHELFVSTLPDDTIRAWTPTRFTVEPKLKVWLQDLVSTYKPSPNCNTVAKRILERFGIKTGIPVLKRQNIGPEATLVTSSSQPSSSPLKPSSGLPANSPQQTIPRVSSDYRSVRQSPMSTPKRTSDRNPNHPQTTYQPVLSSSSRTRSKPKPRPFPTTADLPISTADYRRVLARKITVPPSKIPAPTMPLRYFYGRTCFMHYQDVENFDDLYINEARKIGVSLRGPVVNGTGIPDISKEAKWMLHPEHVVFNKEYTRKNPNGWLWN